MTTSVVFTAFSASVKTPVLATKPLLACAEQLRLEVVRSARRAWGRGARREREHERDEDETHGRAARA
jgi:hypothetical protein